MTNLEKIKSYYKIEEKRGQLGLISPNGKKKIFPMPSYKLPIYITFDKKVEGSSKEEKKAFAEKKVEEGEFLKILALDLYREYYDWSEEDEYFHVHGFSKRTGSYLDAVLENIGYIKTIHGYDEADYEGETVALDAYFNASGELGLTKEGEWCASLHYQTAIDDYNVEKIYFKNKPSTNDVRIAVDIKDLKFKFAYKGLKEVFTCWECGHKRHWLDIEDDFTQKYNKLEEKCCCE